MSEAYEIIKKDFTQTKKDLLFQPELLTQLEDNEKREIESLIINEAKLGNISSFKYLPYLDYRLISEELTKEAINKFPNSVKAEICSYLYPITKLYTYVDTLTSIAYHDPEVFHTLIKMYKVMEEGRVKEETGKTIFHIQKTNGFIYKELYEKELLSEGINLEPEKKPIQPISEDKKELYKSIKNFRDILLQQVIEKGIKERSNINNSLYGFIVGDALGVPVEFLKREELHKKPVTEMRAFGSHMVPKGTWSDDTSMTLATMDSMTRKKTIDYNDIMFSFKSWVIDKNYTATGSVFDIGNTTREAIRQYSMGTPLKDCGEKDFYSNGNGSLMRMLPIAFYLTTLDIEEDKKVEIVNTTSSLTHDHEISKMGCYIYTKYIEALLKGISKEEAYKYICSINYSKYYSQETIKVYERILNGNLKELPINQVYSTGYIVYTLEAVLWSILNNDNYRETLIRAVNLGSDTDTIGAITGSLAGILYGYSNIPKEWLSVIPKKDYLNGLITDFNATFMNIEPNNKKVL